MNREEAREEAIAVLENEIKCVDKDCNIERSCGSCPYAMPSKEPILEAYRLAIETLEQEPCEDCISREEAIKPFLVDSTEEWTSADVVKYLKSLLSVMPTWRYPQVPGITPIVVPVEEESEDIQYDNKTTLNKGWRSE